MIEVIRVDSQILMRDSKDPTLAPLPFSQRQWAGVLSNVRADRLPWPVVRQGDGRVCVSAPSDRHGHRLRFYESEWSAFVEAVKAGNFDLERVPV